MADSTTTSADARSTDAADEATPEQRRSSPPAPRRFRRQPTLLAAAVLLVTVGALLAAFLVSRVGETDQVLALQTHVYRGQVLTEDDLVVAAINTDPALAVVPASRMQDMVGQRMLTDIPRGSLLTEDSVGQAPIPDTGQSVVGIAVPADRRPAQPIHPGDTIRVVSAETTQAAPDAEAEAPTRQPLTIEAIVVAVTSTADESLVIIDVTVPADVGARLAALVTSGSVAIVLDGPS